MNLDIKSPKLRTLEKLLFVLILCTYASFFSIGEWNQASRYNAIFATVENQDPNIPIFSIDAFIKSPQHNFNTGDWSFYDGHYYSNKAPGTTLLGILIYYPLYVIEKLVLNLNIESEQVALFNSWLLNFFISILPLALACIYFFKLVLLLKNDIRLACLLTISCFFGTLLFPYSQALWGSTTAAAFNIIGLYYFSQACLFSKDKAGLILGIAVLFEYSSALIVIICLLTLLLSKNRRQTIHFLRGGMLPLCLYCIYHSICFGNPFMPATSYNNPMFLDQHLAGGQFRLPQISIALQLLFSGRCGLLTYSPIFIFLPWSFYAWYKSREKRVLLIVSMASCGLFFLMNCGFNGWHGGQVMGPRYLIPIIPFGVLGLSYVGKNIKLNSIFYLLLSISFFNMLVIGSVSTVYKAVTNPYTLFDYYRLFGNGIIAQWRAPLRLILPQTEFLQRYSSFNFGELLGLSSFISIVPSALIWLICLTLLVKQMKNSENKDT